jgi:hypothetical protein
MLASMSRLATVLCLSACVVACGRSTEPSNVDLALLASRFDALAHEREEAGDPSGAGAASVAAFVLRLGIPPTRMSMTVDGTADDFLALEMEFGDDVTEPPQSIIPGVHRTLVAWRGARPDRVLSIGVQGDSGSFETRMASAQPEDGPHAQVPMFGILFDRGEPPLVGITGGGHTVRQSIDETPCEPPRTPLFVSTSCQRVTFLTRFTMTAHVMPVTSPEIRPRVVSMREQTVAGVRLFEAP